ncbi:uncharacterized protein EHS24_008968 [Apiotrichum porosum]|uniref:Uncharacterized protein n=1 Tax=Apiotrichum porosum TaxID=105984 RepID=A0A427XNP0_9TREE|nr:uncharacterized protein EHS24_008968 [Apiotrichum porosum]RSH80392.1 hypothetical protein EHS24_008968 [Apiotrichum porosum]
MVADTAKPPKMDIAAWTSVEHPPKADKLVKAPKMDTLDIWKRDKRVPKQMLTER